MPIDQDILKQLDESIAQMDAERRAKEAGVKEALDSAGTEKHVIDEGLTSIMDILNNAAGGKLSSDSSKSTAIEFILAKLEGRPLSEVSLANVETARSSSVEERHFRDLANVPKEFQGGFESPKLNAEKIALIHEQVNDAVDTFIRSMDISGIVDMSSDNPNKVEDVKKLLLGEEKK